LTHKGLFDLYQVVPFFMAIQHFGTQSVMEIFTLIVFNFVGLVGLVGLVASAFHLQGAIKGLKTVRASKGIDKGCEVISENTNKIKGMFTTFILECLYFQTNSGYMHLSLLNNKRRPVSFYGSMMMTDNKTSRYTIPLHSKFDYVENLMYDYLIILCYSYSLITGNRREHILNVASVRDISMTYVPLDDVETHCRRMLVAIDSIISNLSDIGIYKEEPAELKELLYKIIVDINEIERMKQKYQLTYTLAIKGGGVSSVNDFVSDIAESIDCLPDDEKRIIHKMFYEALGH